ncbi:CBU_0585 family protein [Fastidiosibacter lacustris]|uniref:CBU_0585 family protein n=1 Tax=Fastidiosibacter lacustris TaxID=2056695 RepID=UPI000E356C29|nr:CBU_0585 family protein [Fastidiosibacter lacustris]
MSIILKMLHLFDNKKQREYVSEAGQFLSTYDRDFPTRSSSQKKEAQKHRNIFNRKTDDFKL